MLRGWLRVCVRTTACKTMLLNIKICIVHSSDGLEVKVSASGAVNLRRFDVKSGQTNDFKIDIRSFPAGRSELKGQCGEQAGKFPCCAVGKGT